MTEAELIQEIKDDLSASCSLPYNLNDQEIIRIINRAKAWMYDNYQYAVEKRFFILGGDLFTSPNFLKTRQIQLPDKIVTVFDVREANQPGISGNPDRDFGSSKLLGSELLLSPFMGDNLVYRTVMYSYFDLARAYLLETFAFNWNKNSKKLTILGRNPAGSPNNVGTGPNNYIRSVAVSCFVALEDSELFNDELFSRYCRAKAKQQLARVISSFDYNLPGGVRVNVSELKSMGDSEMQEVMDMINGENTPSYFLQWNTFIPLLIPLGNFLFG
jgi:hypothetical protein